MYTNQKISWEKCTQNEGSVVNRFGDIARQTSVQILARKQPHCEVVQDDLGREVLTKSVFYVDPQVEPNALQISKMDKLDGETVINVYEMCDLLNKPRMVRFYTV